MYSKRRWPGFLVRVIYGIGAQCAFLVFVAASFTKVWRSLRSATTAV